MTEPPLLLSPQEAKKRFYLYFMLKLAGLAAFFGGILLARGEWKAIGVVLLIAGAASLFVRPRHLGLTTRPEE